MCANVIVWGTGTYYSNYKNLLSFCEMKGDIKILGVTSNDSYYKKLDGYDFIRKSDIPLINFDYIIVTAVNLFPEIVREIESLGISHEKVLRGDIFEIPNFSFLKYTTLLREKLTIVTNNCWGGVTYHSLKMPFYSPFINMFIDDEDYIRLIYSLKEYMNEDLRFFAKEINPVERFEYPVFLLGDVKLHMNHYHSSDEAIQMWYTRKNRMNWNNLFLMMYTTSKAIARQFDDTNYEKKICFVPFEVNGKSLMSVIPYMKQYEGKKAFWEIVLGMASGKYPYYDAIELLYTGKQVLRTA